VEHQQKRRLCALVVDDNCDAAESFAQVLGVLGCDAVFITEPRNALAEIVRLKPHIAFLDIAMPHLSGYDLARLLRAEYGERLKLVAVTGHGEAEDREAARKAGFDAHVLKPIDPALVQAIIKTVLPEG
jgi:CheY-like chemotaxis protein